MCIIIVRFYLCHSNLKKVIQWKTYDIYFKEGNDFANKGFSLKDKAKAIRMAEDMLAERKGYVKDFVGGTISVMCKETKEEVWSKPIEEV